VNEEGRIVSGNDAKFSHLSSDKGFFQSLVLGQETTGGLLQADGNGLVSSTNSAFLNSLNATSVIVSTSLTVTEIYLQNLLNSPLLVTDSNGKLQSSSQFTGESIRVQQGQIKDLKVEKLTFPSLETNSLLSINSDGEMTSTHRGKLD
jgi:hypothetical protein